MIDKYDHEMDTRQVEYAVAVADELSFRRAAERVFAVQSTVSAGVRALERELGLEIFERDQRGVRLTSGGESVMPLLRDFLDAGGRVRTAADPQRALRGVLRIGIFANLGYLDLADTIGAFHQDHPLVDLRLSPSPRGSVGLAEEVRRGRLDIALFGLPSSAAQGLRSHRLAVSQYAAVLPSEHPLANADSIGIAELSNERFVDTPEGFGNRDVLDAALIRRGITRDTSTEVAEIGSIPAFVAAGLGVAVVPEFFVRAVTGTVVVPLTEQIDWEFSAITRPRPAAAAAALLERLMLNREAPQSS